MSQLDTIKLISKGETVIQLQQSLQSRLSQELNEFWCNNRNIEEKEEEVF